MTHNAMAARKGKPGYPAGGSGYARESNDFYVEQPWVTRLLLKSLDDYGEPIIGEVYDPFAGSGTIPSVCRDHGIPARGSDLAEGRFGPRIDAFTIPEFENVITNVPYGIAVKCIRYLVPRTKGRVFLILRLGIWESRVRNLLFREFPPIWWMPCSDRPSMPPGVMNGNHRDRHGACPQPPSSGGKAPYCWLVFQRDYRGPIGGARLPDLLPKTSRVRLRGPTLSAANQSDIGL